MASLDESASAQRLAMGWALVGCAQREGSAGRRVTLKQQLVGGAVFAVAMAVDLVTAPDDFYRLFADQAPQIPGTIFASEASPCSPVRQAPLDRRRGPDDVEERVLGPAKHADYKRPDYCK